MMRKCRDCLGEMEPSEFVYHYGDGEGPCLNEMVSGHECGQCGAQLISAPDAERISEKWLAMRAERAREREEIAT